MHGVVMVGGVGARRARWDMVDSSLRDGRGALRVRVCVAFLELFQWRHGARCAGRCIQH